MYEFKVILLVGEAGPSFLFLSKCGNLLIWYQLSASWLPSSCECFIGRTTSVTISPGTNHQVSTQTLFPIARNYCLSWRFPFSVFVRIISLWMTGYPVSGTNWHGSQWCVNNILIVLLFAQIQGDLPWVFIHFSSCVGSFFLTVLRTHDAVQLLIIYTVETGLLTRQVNYVVYLCLSFTW